MTELQGLPLITNQGWIIGTIENSYDTNGQTIIQYHNNSGYCEAPIPKERTAEALNNIKIRAGRLNIINERKINHIFHFSPMQNLKGILKYGILSRELAKECDINIMTTDSNRYDNQLDRISASISFPNYRMRYTLEQNNNFKFLMYDISPRILLVKLDTQFYPTNAANKAFWHMDKNKLTTNEAFLDMFYEQDRVKDLYIAYTTDPQAEILIKDMIDKEFITAVMSERHNSQIHDICDKNNINYSAQKTLYKYRSDWRDWQ